MDADELSELGELLWEACARAERMGFSILGFSPFRKEACCPFGALLLMNGAFSRLTWRWPGRVVVEKETGIDGTVIDEFFIGVAVDGPPSKLGLRMKETEAMKLGRLFREQAQRGGFS